MLLALSLSNFVTVEQLNLDFQTGFTVLTGETGAGKSITLDAIGLLLGDKADYGQVRTGTAEARLSALFDLSDLPDLQAELREQGLLSEEAAELSIRRIIDAKGKSRSFVNDQAVTLAQLKHIGSRLIDIHGQNTHHSLNQESAQRKLLDAFAGCTALAASVKAAYQTRQAALQALEDAKQQAESIAVERERLEWQANELAKLNLQNGEWESLSQNHDSLAHATELIQSAQETEHTIEGDGGIQSRLYQCRKTLEQLSGIEPLFAESLDMLASIEAELSEISANMRNVAAKVEVNPQELAAQEARMSELMGMARKYRVEPEALPEKQAELETALQALDAAADLEALAQAVSENEAAYQQAAQQLSAERRRAAAKLSSETTGHMQHLAMKGANFHIELLPSTPSASGLEQVQYQVSTNQGSPLRPLNKVASGGELARISLALQVVTSRYTQVPTLIFDEVDTGIGGGVAETVGRALRALGGKHQVLAVTHLPQVTACGENHWKVEKRSTADHTTSEINLLTGQDRIEEIARMLGGETITDTTRSHAAELLDMAKETQGKPMPV
ncbi:MAG: DNA repair protein RecN [Neisseria sp.]|uniref:DNA repair protein RecN n=1 Tax=Neisseria sp. TaxID=192066 RepID=UPI0026DC5A1F|nr:DNA repair protein RecN [Neisseria sp.]MDO4641807.1 DNA repair protein RecN [Neisseria sp.]